MWQDITPLIYPILFFLFIWGLAFLIAPIISRASKQVSQEKFERTYENVMRESLRRHYPDMTDEELERRVEESLSLYQVMSGRTKDTASPTLIRKNRQPPRV
jgi:hypothetical protein